MDTGVDDKGVEWNDLGSCPVSRSCISRQFSSSAAADLRIQLIDYVWHFWTLQVTQMFAFS
jgi:hypothetical protein